MAFVALSLGLINMTAVLISFAAFDRILRVEHDLHPRQWASDGQPIGFFWFWVPQDASSLSGSISRARLALEWAFHTPDWMQSHRSLRYWLCIMRAGLFTCWTTSSLIIPILVLAIFLG